MSHSYFQTSEINLTISRSMFEVNSSSSRRKSLKLCFVRLFIHHNAAAFFEPIPPAVVRKLRRPEEYVLSPSDKKRSEDAQASFSFATMWNCELSLIAWCAEVLWVWLSIAKIRLSSCTRAWWESIFAMFTASLVSVPKSRVWTRVVFFYWMIFCRPQKLKRFVFSLVMKRWLYL